MTFDPAVYNAIREGIQRSSAVILPMILNALPSAERLRCLDVGCGEGWWSEGLWDAGAADVDSIDHPVPEQAAEGVIVLDVDLEGAYQLQRGYDLALCLEVAEHLSAPAGDELVRQLCRSSRAVAWSAAIPAQGGSGHQNEQWPAYWEERFAAYGFALLDPWRAALWGHPDVEPWYQQNLLLAVPSSGAGNVGNVAPLVHPAFYESRVQEREACYGYARTLEARIAAAEWVSAP